MRVDVWDVWIAVRATQMGISKNLTSSHYHNTRVIKEPYYAPLSIKCNSCLSMNYHRPGEFSPSGEIFFYSKDLILKYYVDY